MKRQLLCAVMTASLILSACGQTSAPGQESTEIQATAQEESAEISPVKSAEAEKDVSENADADAMSTENKAVLQDASEYAASIDNSSIDASVYLDYSAGIEAGVYNWIPSEDGDYYTLAYVDENGKPVETGEQKINVGANNEESIDNGKGDMPGEGGGKPEGTNGMPGGMGMGGPEGKGGMGGPGGMFGNQGTVYQGVYMNASITNLSNQTMLVYVPAAYLTADEAGNVTGIDHEAVIGSYNADTAPIVYLNECGGWRSSSPRAADTSYLEQGMIYVTAGARSRDAMDESGTIHTGKAPTQMVDLKSGIIELRANSDVIPGDKDRIISIGTSGGGQMSSILGASGNMPEYYEYMYESGVLGVTKNADGTYSSAYPDNIYGAQLYCPIADFENSDLAYAWWWADLADDGGTYRGSMTDFERRLQELEADAFVDYLNGLHLKDAEGNELTLTGLREGSYYDAVLQNISDALNAYVDAGETDPAAEYPDSEDWLKQNEDGSWQITDMRGFMIGTGLVNNRNKAIPGFDTFDKSAENDAFGRLETDTAHFAKGVAQILSDNYEELSKLDGFDREAVDEYIAEALTGEDADYIENQADLLNATEIMLRGAGALDADSTDQDGPAAVDPALYWRDRSGTADQHTSFSIGYNILLAAQMMGRDIDYHLVWNMGHGSNEGTSTGTFIDWINEICGDDAAESSRSSASSIESVRFDSSVTGTEQRMQVYKPAGYNENQKYPVLYLINGGFTDDTAWLGMGLQETADQMMEDGSMSKMLIVMPDGSLHEPQDQNDADLPSRREDGSREGAQEKERQSGDRGQQGWSGEMPDDEVEEIDPIKQAEANETRAKFVAELTGDIIPYVEAHYSVYADRDSRAVAGFSYGGAEALYAGVGCFDQFSHIGVFSMGIMGGSDAGPRAIQGSGSSLTPEEFVKEYPDFFADADTTNKDLNLFWIGVGKDDNIIAGGAKLLSDTLDEYGIDHEFHETEGGHTPDNWLAYFKDFGAKLFPAERIYQNVFKMDTHLHVDVPMEEEDMPWEETPDLGKAMEDAGMNAIGMAFAVDYVELKGNGHAYKRFMNALDEMDRILEANDIQRTLNYDQMMEHFEKGEPVVIQSVEGGHFLEGDVSRIQEAYDRGLRVFCLLHDNDADPPLGDVYTNEPQYGGLTELGAATIEECERLGILVDLAHCDDNTVAMALEKATKPLMISHTGLKGAVDENDFMAKMMQQRLISPETAKLVADHDGVIGIWPHLANTPEQYAANIKAMVEVVGVDHVTIGTDSKITTEFNEWENMPHDDNEGKGPEFGDGEMPELPEGIGGFGQKNEDAVNHVWNAEEDNFYHSVVRCLVKEGFNEEEIGKLTGGNFARIFKDATSR